MEGEEVGVGSSGREDGGAGGGIEVDGSKDGGGRGEEEEKVTWGKVEKVVEMKVGVLEEDKK